MRAGSIVRAGTLVLIGMSMLLLARGKEPLAEARTPASDDPMFIRWLHEGDPGDEAIRVYWQKAEAAKASPAELVDLGTMLFYRGYPKDAVRMYRRAIKLDKTTYEAWFRIGLVEHRQGNIRAARRAYRKCLKHLTGHGWCNFYMGRLHEELGNPTKALYYFRRAFKFAPALADPDVNPELLYSKLQFGAVMHKVERDRFTSLMPMFFLEPGRIRNVQSAFLPLPEQPEQDLVPATPQPVVTPPTPTPTPTPDPQVKQPAVTPRTKPGQPEVRHVVRPTPQPREGQSLLRVPRPGQPERPRRRMTPVPRQATPPPRTQPPAVPSVSSEAALGPLWKTPLERAAELLLQQPATNSTTCS